MLVLDQEHWQSSEVRRLVALIASEHIRTQAIFDALPLGVCIISTEGRVVWSNRRLRAFEPHLANNTAEILNARDRARISGTPVSLEIGSAPSSARLLICPPVDAFGGAAVACEFNRPDLAPAAAESEPDASPVLEAIGESLAAAFPGARVARASVPAHYRYTIITGGRQRTLAITHDAMESPDLRQHLASLPEALNFTTSILLTKSGITAGDCWSDVPDSPE